MKARIFIVIFVTILFSEVSAQTYCTSYGTYAGNLGYRNSSFGYYSGSNVTGSYNTFNGYRTGYDNTSGSYNVFIGSSTGENITTGTRNTFLGYRVGVLATTAGSNTSVGSESGTYLSSGSNNSFFGYGAGYSTRSAIHNTYIGSLTGRNSTGSDNVFLGYKAGYNEMGSNKLYIENSDSIKPLIYGEFDNDLVTINGTLGIGTTDVPNGYSFAVDGKIIVTEVKVEALPWADFVFASDYNLMPLPTLASFIKEYNHLPDIPSAEEVATEGISLGEMDALLLQKIEELTLYIIELKQDNDALRDQVDSLLQ